MGIWGSSKGLLFFTGWTEMASLELERIKVVSPSRHLRKASQAEDRYTLEGPQVGAQLAN